MMLKHFLLVLLLAGLWSFSYSCVGGNGGRGGNGGNSEGNGNGGNGGSGGNGRKRSSHESFSLDFAVFDADNNGRFLVQNSWIFSLTTRVFSIKQTQTEMVMWTAKSSKPLFTFLVEKQIASNKRC